MDHHHNNINRDTLVAENIFLSIGQKDILQGATIRAVKGTITGLLGLNGAGKSTMLQSVFGTRKAQECDVFINGKMIKRAYLITGLINYLPQKPFLPGQLSARNVAEQFGVDVESLLRDFPELRNEVDKKIRELSGGTERLISVLVLLMAGTRFTFLDEPFSHIMPLYTERLKTLLLQQKEKKGIIVTDHMYNQLLNISDCVYLMKEGQSVFIRDKSDLVLHGYLNDYQE